MYIKTCSRLINNYLNREGFAYCNVVDKLTCKEISS